MHVTGGASVEGAVAPASTRGSQAPGAQDGPEFSSFLDLAMAGRSELGEDQGHPDTGEDPSEHATGAEAVLAESLGAALQLPPPVIVVGPGWSSDGSPAGDAAGTVDPVNLDGSSTASPSPDPRMVTGLARGTTSFPGETRASQPQVEHPSAGLATDRVGKEPDRVTQSPGLSGGAAGLSADETSQAGTLSSPSGVDTGPARTRMATGDDIMVEAINPPIGGQQTATSPALAARTTQVGSPGKAAATLTPELATTASDPGSAIGTARNQAPAVGGVQSEARGEGNSATGTNPPGEAEGKLSGDPAEAGDGARGTSASANLHEGTGASAGVRQSEAARIPSDDATEAGVLRQLLPHLSRLSVPRNPQMRVHLTPPSLGPLDLHLRLIAGSLSLDIMAATEQARGFLEGALPDLRQYLESRGIEVSQLSLGMAGSSGDGTGAGVNLAFSSQEDLDARGKQLASPLASQEGEAAGEGPGIDPGGQGRRNLVDYRV